MSHQRRHNPKITTPVLYAVVFETVYTKYLVGFLFLFFMVHPAVPVFAANTDAAESVVSTSEPAPEPAETVAPEPVSESVEATVFDQETDSAETIESEAAASAETDTPASEEDTNNLLQAAVTSENQTEQQASVTEGTVEADTTEPDTSVPAVASSTVSGSLSTSSPPPTAATSIATSSTPAVNEATPAEAQSEEFASSTNEVVDVKNDATIELDDLVAVEPSAAIATTSKPATTKVVYAENPNALSFAPEQCVTVDNGSFYCSTITKSDQPIVSEALYAAMDAEGDREIYIQLKGAVKQLTNNQYDDAAPKYDETSNTVVWHRLLDERYQIILYDLNTQEETIITSGNENNMEPQHEAGITVWQRWVDNNWEIMLYDGKEEKQLTHSEAQDIAPDIRQGFVIWSITDANNQKTLGVYEIATDEFTVIEDPDGGQVTNPRFVLMYDTKFANGDVITKGFNPSTGELEPLSAVPGQLPTIPAADPTGETRALLQNKNPSGRDDVEELVDNLVREYTNNKATNAATSSAATSS